MFVYSYNNHCVVLLKGVDGNWSLFKSGIRSNLFILWCGNMTNGLINESFFSHMQQQQKG